MNSIPDLYKKYFIDTGNERIDLFKLILKEFAINKALYPGCFVHITPSFIFNEVVYVDVDKRCKHFFSNEHTFEYITNNKKYNGIPLVRFYENNFE